GHVGEAVEEFRLPVFAAASQALSRSGVARPEHGVELWPFAVAWALALLGGGLAWLMYMGRLAGTPARFAERLPALYRLVADKFRIDELYDVLIVRPVSVLAELLWKVVDAFAIDGVL